MHCPVPRLLMELIGVVGDCSDGELGQASKSQSEPPVRSSSRDALVKIAALLIRDLTE